MRFTARMMATMAVALLLAPALCADDTAKPAAKAKKAEAVHPRVAPGTVAKPMPAAPMSSSRPAAAAPQSSAGAWSADNRTPTVELFLGYSYVRAVPQKLGNRIVYLHGGTGSIAFNVTDYLGLVADFGGYRSDRIRLTGGGTPASVTLDADGTVFTYMFGPRLSYRNQSRVTPFGQLLFGVAHASEVTLPGCMGFPSCAPLPSENALAIAVGGGLDVQVHRNIALRTFQAEYLMTRFRNPSPGAGQSGTRTNLRLSAGIVFLFGGDSPPPPPPSNRSPVATCSAEVSTASAGDVIAVRAQASDADNDSLTYSWTTTGGAVQGSGSDVRWNSAGLAPGSYDVRVRVADNRGGTADCSVSIRVEAPANRAPSLTCSAERSSVLAGERVRIRGTASDPDSDQLTYSWRSNGGQVVGSGASVQLDTSGLAPGRYTVTGRVEDGRGGAADCSATVAVETPAAPPQASKINECFFRSSSARVDNVCKRILDDVALRMQNDPRGRVVFIGYADSQEPRPDRLAGQRSDAAKDYLREKGIADSRVDVRTAGGQAGAGRQNHRIDIVWVPEGATY